MREMTAASTEALQRPRKERERFRRFIVDVVTQGECVPAGRRREAPGSAAGETGVDAAAAAGGVAEQVRGVPSSASAPLTTGEKDLLRYYSFICCTS